MPKGESLHSFREMSVVVDITWEVWKSIEFCFKKVCNLWFPMSSYKKETRSNSFQFSSYYTYNRNTKHQHYLQKQRRFRNFVEIRLKFRPIHLLHNSADAYFYKNCRTMDNYTKIYKHSTWSKMFTFLGALQ